MTVAKPLWLDEKCPIEITTAAEFSDHKVREFLDQIASYYPNFRVWLDFTFVSQLRGGKRKALIVKENNEIAGISLLKKVEEENKICTFFIAPQYRSQGYGKLLMEESLAFLGNQVNITVCEERWKEMQGFLYQYGFRLNAAIPNYYRSGSTEFFCSR
ncbi:GNAT family N-acetyltransferase [Dickeya zeae]|uniref:GNAT family N-acetyltransferase n=1 Tax=Dickeya zeae TaxID=204042 RepID=UPI001C62C88C|nr:GNAT family N-acetyltransferase [Dickeya zeae]